LIPVLGNVKARHGVLIDLWREPPAPVVLQEWYFMAVEYTKRKAGESPLCTVTCIRFGSKHT
jgi:hypothetical protein